MNFRKFMMDDDNQSKWLEKVYGAENEKELAASYDAWAKDYDRDVLGFGYKLPAIMTGLIGRYVAPGNGAILDAGTGTGILGETLALMGYQHIVGIDLSRGMLEMAKKKGVHHRLFRMTLGKRLDFPDDTFESTVAMGVFTQGHAPPDSFDELIRITKPEGYIIFSVRADVYLNQGFKERQDILEKEGKWRIIEKTEAFKGLPLVDSEHHNRIFVYQVS